MIVGMPRSGTQVMQTIMSWLFKIPNLYEPFNDQNLGFDPINSICHTDPYQWTADLKKGVFKLLSLNLYYIDIKRLLERGGIDHTILMDRANLTDCCVSAYYANTTKIYHYDRPVKGQVFECPSQWVRQWIKSYHRYQEARKYVMSSAHPHSVISYEDFVLDKVQYVAGHAIQSSKMVKNAKIQSIFSNLPYDQLCINYQAVKEQIDSLQPWAPTYKYSHQDT